MGFGGAGIHVDGGELEERIEAREISANGFSMKASEVEAKLDDGNIHEAEAALREGLALNYEEARALLGKLEYQRGNIEGALRVFEGIDLQAAIQRLQTSLSEKAPSRRRRSRTDSLHSVSQHAATLVLEAIYLKSLSLQKFGKVTEAAQECRSILDAVEKIFQNGIPDALVDNRLQETVSRAVELLPELWKQSGHYQEALISYRRALLSQWNLDNECCARIQKNFSAFLLYGGIEAASPSLASHFDGSFVPKNNFEEAILLLMILLRKSQLGKIQWDPSVMEHLSFALSICGKTSVLGLQYEDLLPGLYTRCDRWNILALCYSGAGQNKVALNLLRKSLSMHENPNDIHALLLAAKICSENSLLASEGAGYAQRAVSVSQEADEHLKVVSLRLLGVCLGKQAKLSSSDKERSRLQAEALKSFEAAIALEPQNPEFYFDLGLQYAENWNLDAALQCAKLYVDATGGSITKGWRLLALVLSAQQRYPEAEVVIDAALDETSKWAQGSLLKIKAKLKVSQSLHMEALETYRLLLALVQAQRKSNRYSENQVEDDKLVELEVWQGIANMYSSLCHWRDAQICLDKAKALNPFSVAIMHTEGAMHESQGEFLEALATYNNGFAVDPSHVPCKEFLGVLLWRQGSTSLPVARAFLSDALRLDPTNRRAWYYLGMVNRDEGRLADAADCFQAASMLDGSDPVESFSSIT